MVFKQKCSLSSQTYVENFSIPTCMTKGIYQNKHKKQFHWQRWQRSSECLAKWNYNTILDINGNRLMQQPSKPAERYSHRPLINTWLHLKLRSLGPLVSFPSLFSCNCHAYKALRRRAKEWRKKHFFRQNWGKKPHAGLQTMLFWREPALSSNEAWQGG